MKTTFRAFIALTLSLFFAVKAYSQFNIAETFRDNTVSNGITLGGSAYLTSGNGDPAGNGWLRLTESVNNQAGYALVQQAFPSAMGVLIDFEYTTWSLPGSGSGADGLSVFLFDASYSDSFHIGGYGGSLGYARHDSQQGLSGGYMGLGLDEYGNYSNPTENRNGGPGFRPNVVALRGPAPNYTYLSGNQVLASDAGTGDNGGIDYNTTTSTRPTASQFYRRVQVSLEPVEGTYKVTVKWKKSVADSFHTLFGPVVMTSPPPAMLKLGLAASTGAQHNYHEIRNMRITTPGNISVTKQGPAYITASANPTGLSYDITVKNQTPVAVSDISIQDLLPAGYTVSTDTGISIQQYGNTGNSISNITIANGILSGVASLAPNTEITMHLNGVFSNGHAGQSIRNTVKISSNSIVDMDTTNNVDTVYTLVQAPLPVRLSYFNAQKRQEDVLLSWETSMEVNNDRFEIERSTDGRTYEVAGTVKGMGTRMQASDYTFTDAGAALLPAATLYYRLHQVDKDGKSDYSMVRMVALGHDGNKLALKAYPVPFTGRLSVELNSTVTVNAPISLYNASGRRVYAAVTPVQAGIQLIDLNGLEGLPAGVYVLECVLGKENMRIKVTK